MRLKTFAVLTGGLHDLAMETGADVSGACWAQPPGRKTDRSGQIGYKSAADAEQKKTLLLRDFHPVSMLHVPTHEVPKAKFYVIDVHNHINDAARIEEHMPPERVVEIMDRTNVKTVVILTGMWGDKLQHVIDEMVKPYPGRFMVFTQLDYSKIDDPNFGEEMVRLVDDSVARGARGLKFLKDLGLGVRDKSGKLLAIDDPRLDPVWRECGRLGIPVFIHTGDPEAFFHPTDARNERYEELTEHPDWSFYGPQFPSLEQLLEARNRVFARHPETLLFRCTWAGRKIWTGFPACSTNILMSWSSLGRAKRSWDGSRVARANSFLSIRTG